VVLAHESITKDVLEALATPSFLVIDEAHQIARGAWSADPKERARDRVLEGLARVAPKVLLLTGTPLLHDEDGFLAMLHLLDPAGYPLDDREGFAVAFGSGRRLPMA
jgi:ATP-dependent helicase HepA